MFFHTFGDVAHPTILLIHGVWMPWSAWMPQIEALQDCYYVVVPALDAHDENQQSELHSIGEEASAIVEYFLAQQVSEIYAIYGLSMGEAIAYTIAIDGRLKIEHLMLDGAPLVSSFKLLVWMMKHQYIKCCVN